MEILALKLFFVICLSRVELSTQVVPEVLDGPVTQTVPVTQYEAQFTCRARASAVFWYINGETLFNNIPSWIILYDDIHDFPNVEVTRRIGVRTQGRNRTKIECLATGSDQATDRSEPPVFLYIVDVLNAPVTELVTVNTTALRVSWFEPFAHTGFPILNYTLIIRSTADHSAPLYNASLSALEYVLTTDSVHRDCHNITFEVIATNSIGPSAAGVAIGGFPIFLGDFLLPPVVVVTFTADLAPIINITFKPPTVCWFQDASYELRILDASTQALSLSTRIGSYHGGGITTISEAYNDGVDLEKVYDAIVIIDTLTGTKNASSRFNTSYSVAPQDIPLLTIVNSTAISVHWNRTSSIQHNVAISYILVIRNESDHFYLQEEVFNVSADFTSYPMVYLYNSADVANVGCHNISFTVLARSSDDENERPGNAVSGFPVGPSEFASNVTTEVIFTRDLVPRVSISFEYPPICWYQKGTYKIQLFVEDTEVMFLGPLTYRGTDNSRITRSFSTGLVLNQLYRTVVTAETFGESIRTESDFSTAFGPNQQTTSPVSPASTGGISTPTGLSTVIVIAIALGSSIIVALIVGISIVLIIVSLRQRKRKVETQRRPRMPEVNNPLYETGGPIYEEIPGEKNFNTLIREQQPTGPGTPSSEYVTIEGKMNGGAMHYNVIRMQEEEFKEIKKPLDQNGAGFPAKDFDAMLTLPLSRVPSGEDAYTIMNPATARVTKEQSSCHSLPRNDAMSLSTHSPIRPSLSLQLVSQRLNRQESETDDTPEERYVRRSLLN